MLNPYEKAPKVNGYFLWAIGSFFLFYQYLIRVAPSIFINDIMGKYDINSIIFGQFSGIYYIGYALSHIPIGVLLDKFSIKKQLLLYLGFVILGTSSFVFSDQWSVVFIGRLLTGIGSSAAVLGLFKIVSTYFNDKFSRMMSFSAAIGLFGALNAGAPLKFISNHHGFINTLNILIGLGLLLWTIILLYVKDGCSKTSDNSDISLKNIYKEVMHVFSNRIVIGMSLLLGLMIGVVEGFADIWGVAFMAKAKYFGDYEATSVVSIIYLAMCIGTPVIGIIAEKFNKYFLSLFICSVLITLPISIIILLDINSYILGAILMFLIGVGASYQIIGIYKATTYVDDSMKTLTASTVNMIIMIFGYFFHSIIGWVISIFENIGYSGAESMKYGMLIIPLCSAISCVIFLTIHCSVEKFPHHTANLKNSYTN